MSKGSAIAAILIAFVGGLAIGHITGKSFGGGSVSDAELGAIAGAEVERYKVPVTDSQPQKGPDDALVTIVEVSDFQCPFCKRVVPTVETLHKDYGDKIRVVWMNNPLPFHKDAGPAAQLALEAHEQGGDKKFWAAHDMLFENQQSLSRADLEKYAGSLGLDVGKVKKALDGKTHQSKIQQDQQLAQKLGARGTPAFFINGRKLMGAQPLEKFKEVIDDEIVRANKLVESGVSEDEVYAEITRNGLTQEAAAKPANDNAPARKVPDPKAVYKITIDGEPQKGPDDALVTIVEYSDFECPFCSRVEPTVTKIMEEYGKDVRVVWKNNPLPFHKNAGPAAQASLEAYAQGGNKKFWAMHKLLFENQRALSRENLEKFASQLGLNMTKFKQALDTNKHQSTIDKHQASARSVGAMGTPSFFINGRNLRGAQPFPAFKSVIDEELKKARALVAKGTPRNKLYTSIVQNGATTPQYLDGPPGGGKPAGPDPNKIYKIAVPKGAPKKGASNAKVIIQEFSDFQCPFCGRVLPTLKQIMDEYGNKVQVVWRNYPLPFHQQAMPAHIAAMEVMRQGGDKKFWAYHDLLFSNQQALSLDDLKKYAEKVGGINTAALEKAIKNNTHKAAIEADMKAVTDAGARIGTPSFFVNGKLLQGAQPFAEFKRVIDEALKK